MKSNETPDDLEIAPLDLDDDYNPELIAEAEAVVAGCGETPDPRPTWEIELEEILAGSDIPAKSITPEQRIAESEYNSGFFDGVRFVQKRSEYKSLDLTETHGKEEIENFFKSLEDLINKLPTLEDDSIDSLNPQVKFCRFGDTIVISDFNCGTEPLCIAILFIQNNAGNRPKLVPTCASMDEIHYLKSRDSEGHEIEIGHNSNVLYMERETSQFIFHTTSTDSELYGPERAEFLYLQAQREMRIFRKLLNKKGGI